MNKTKLVSMVCALMGVGSFAVAESAPVNDVKTYDFKAPFKDYNNKIVLSINNVASGKTVEFTSNFKPKAGWGNCFGTTVDNVNFDTTQNANGDFVTKMTLKDDTASFNFSQSCDIMGTDSGNAVVLPGVVVPIVSSLKVDGKDLDIQRPCENNVCEDPTPGYTNAAYYAQWAVWGRKYNPYDFKYDKLNTIIYAFIGFDKNTGNIKTLDASADSWGLSAAARAAKKYPYLKSFLSFGGWTNNGITTAPMFEQLASNPQSMQNFADQSIELMRKLGFNGIDIDWEWWSDYGNDVAPAKKMLAFFKVLRTELDKAGKADGKKYYLAIAVNGARSRIEAMENPSNPNSVSDFWKQTGELMDEINIMSYDYQGGWGTGFPAYFQASTDFPSNTPYSNRVYSAGASPVDAQDNVTDIGKDGVTLVQAIGKEGGWSIKGAVDAYIAAGVPAKKLIVGLPLYARSMTVDSDVDGGLFQTITAPGIGDYEAGVFDYKCLVNPVNDPVTGCGTAKPVSGLANLKYYDISHNVDVFNKYGKVAMQPWAYSPSTKSFITYDDVWSVGEKTKYTKSRNLGGTMFWQADNDSTDPNKSLINAVAKVYASDTINVSVTDVTENSATVSWNKPELDGSISYKVIVNGNVIAENITALNYVLTNLEKGTRYTVEVVASTSATSREDSLTFETVGAEPADDQNQDQNDDQNNNEDQNQNQNDNEDQNAGDQTASTWKADGVYNKGDRVVVNGVTYEAQWWTQGENPTQTGQWGVWRTVSGQTDNQDNNQGDDADQGNDQGNTDQGDTDTNQGNDNDNSSASGTWDATKVYNKGDKVTYNGVSYEAQWWTQGNKPSDGGAWKKPVVAGGAWESGIAYSGGQTVTYQGSTYKAKWWTQGDTPSNSSVWEKQ
ncbi:fibronectin type III domain-containing protein [Francisella philomiragia]|uniref:chitinase n=1 Tax=Francisella philomiragia subsp. philomiragia (strain ATCC 25017 / CCUG 19701 / FSC 153 / O\|nr:glycosyl hydrolase family 18 protein [Francisella philomiragia]AJI47890.1 fibronectin type III domain protein [Francisella philomiragia]AJI49180.1 fibronectin type III domain protein [Francisella philomiragia]MBK2020069.1 fibronectin type III domain-containing protein [Francisella philomiragia]MBK2029531.1 fibronectin type III domain-containing protein [Francisella philomiragia]MBK2263327.1 fibronectin type III domain-containing protein [Francisella philomiragia]